MNIASIDIGTNTVLLLIAKIDNEKIIPIQNEYRMPRLGKGLTPGGNIREDRIEELYKILEEYNRYINKYNCQAVIACATSAMRIASNSSEIIQKVYGQTGIKINVISGEEEARLSFLGAISAGQPNLPKMVIDVGGGSTEIIYGDNDEVFFSKSYRIGTVSLTEKFLKSNPPLTEELEEMNNYISLTFDELANIIKQPAEVIAVAGTPTSISCINQNLKEYNEEKVENSIVTSEEIGKLIKVMEGITSEEILNRFGNVVKGRNDVILSGACILQNLLRTCSFSEMTVSGKGIRYGAVADYIRTINK